MLSLKLVFGEGCKVYAIPIKYFKCEPLTDAPFVSSERMAKCELAKSTVSISMKCVCLWIRLD